MIQPWLLVLVEKILRLQPDVNKLYLLVRASDEKSATQRLYNEIISTELFRILRNHWDSKFDHLISSKVIAVAGDVSSENLGVKDSNLREKMWNEIEIIVNAAATTDFNERYDVALNINTFGAFNVLNFGKKCDNIKLLLHISTAYVCGEQTGMIFEKQRDNINIFEERRIVEEQVNQLQYYFVSDKTMTSSMKELGLERAKLNGWPNTYVFTKAMGEMVLGNFNGDLPLVIIRPTMISSTYKQPFPGWIEGLRTMDSVIMSYGKGRLTYFLGNLNSALDVIPVDMVANAMVVAMEAHFANHRYSHGNIYHVSSSYRNPMKLSDLRNFIRCYFTKNPWIDTNGKIVKVGNGTVISRAYLFFLSMQLKYVLPLKVLYLMNILSGQFFNKVYAKHERKVKSVMRLAELYKPYVFFTGINLEKLQKMAEERGINMAEFGFDSKSIDWEDYIMNIHIPGLFKYVIRSRLASSE
ncbi:Multidrug resistance protein ABC transporter family [Hibiscus syriacus]|uniref:Fatty acyl-CoA reductase n=1 Tax=Hibiscus syriacus TaxID=106335 RepID=A0A6A2ZK71_HIBSY|nr:Multidrug resistance protein ABC transporter family [Hibiscus syriacus]